MFYNIVKCLLCLFICVSYVRCQFDLPEGTRCEVAGMNGTCFSIYNCLATVADLKNKKQPKICSFKGPDPIVCCTDCEKVNDTRTVVIDTGDGYFFKNGQKARDQCLEHAACLPYKCGTYGLTRFYDFTLGCSSYEPSFEAVVVGGSDAQRYNFPHMALLGYGSGLDSVQWLCGGTLISDRFILTAAHCISGPSTGPVTYVALGILKRTDPEELWHRHRVRKITPHPEYRAPSKYHDIALLEIDPVKNYSTAVFPACLHFGQTLTRDVVATGWGALGKNRLLADTLQQVLLSEFSKKECSTQYPRHRHLKKGYDHTTQSCYGDKMDPKDTCEGDSGGPIQVSSPISRCMWSVVGVTSSGRSCGGGPGESGLYTRVEHYLHWIEGVVWP